MSNKEQAHNIEIEAVFDKDLADKKQAQNSGIDNNQKQHNSAIKDSTKPQDAIQEQVSKNSKATQELTFI